jgi:hypothetical protein
MASHPVCNWTGKSGATYTYFIWPLPVYLDPKQDGNYIYSRKNVEGKWVPIYIGQGDLADRVGEGHHKVTAIELKGATHVHVHLSTREPDRLAEEEDLLARYTNAYHPNGCNERFGG